MAPDRLSQDDFTYDTDTKRLYASRDCARPWHGIEIAIEAETGAYISHLRGWDMGLDSTELDPEHPLNPLISPSHYFQKGEIRSAVVRDNADNRGRFRIRREQHEHMLHRAKHMPPKYHDRYFFAVYEKRDWAKWRLRGYSSLTAPELHDIRDTWTWTDTDQYEIAQITWSQIPGLDPLKIEADHDGYWTLDDF
jgi:hypothetical protein